MRRAALVIAAAVALALAGCGDNEQDGGTVTQHAADGAPVTQPEGGLAPVSQVYWVALPDGRRVLCVFSYGYRKGGPSCDWDHADRTGVDR